MKHLEMALYMRRLHMLVAECAALTTPQIKLIERVLGCIGRRFSGNAVLAHDVCRVREALYASETGKRPGQHAVIAVCAPPPRANTPPETGKREGQHAVIAVCAPAVGQACARQHTA
tara:strand:+ start:807 stop:1157 length:351 start_codon:yes stop_codon:yes gene_type:complete